MKKMEIRQAFIYYTQDIVDVKNKPWLKPVLVRYVMEETGRDKKTIDQAYEDWIKE